MSKEIFRVVTRGADGSLRIKDYPRPDSILRLHTQIGVDDCSTDLISDLVDQGLVLAGGGALTRGIDRFLSEQTGLPTRLCAEPLSAVSRGMYICLEHFDRWRGVMQASDDDV